MELINKIFKYTGYLVVACFFVLGIMVFLTDYFTQMPRNYRFIFGSLLLAYGTFRLISLINKRKYENEE